MLRYQSIFGWVLTYDKDGIETVERKVVEKDTQGIPGEYFDGEAVYYSGVNFFGNKDDAIAALGKVLSRERGESA